MIKELIKLADHLDKKGLYKEASYIDLILKRAGDDKQILDPKKLFGGKLFNKDTKILTFPGKHKISNSDFEELKRILNSSQSKPIELSLEDYSKDKKGYLKKMCSTGDCVYIVNKKLYHYDGSIDVTAKERITSTLEDAFQEVYKRMTEKNEKPEFQYQMMSSEEAKRKIEEAKKNSK